MHENTPEGFKEYLSTLTLEDLEISPDEFSKEEREECEKWCAEYSPYWCASCGSQTMLDRGKRFQCQFCCTEYECEDRSKIDEWRKQRMKRIMGSVR